MTYLIAELGQNMQGSVEVAKDMIRVCANPMRHDLYGEPVGGVDAVKMQKRSLAHELTREAATAAYHGDNAFGATYGEHRATLELTAEEHAECYRYAKALGLDFVDTVCAVEALDELLAHFAPDRLKVASRDLTNHRLLDALAGTRIPLIISTGMADRGDLHAALDVVTAHHDDITILHCRSQYPTDPAKVNLRTITWLKDHYPYAVGYSDHTEGVWAPVAAVALGAEVIEKHVTMSRQSRGTDHPCALEPDGIYRWVRDTRYMEQALGRYDMFAEDATAAARLKLARSVAARHNIPAGVVITEDDIEPLSPGSGIPWPERATIVGGRSVHLLPAQTLLTATMVR